MFTISIQEMLETRLCRVLKSGSWQWLERQPAGGHSALGSGTPGDTLCIQCPREAVGIWFLRHDWSGAVEIVCAGKLEKLELSSQESDLNFFYQIPETTGDSTEILLRVLNVDGRTPERLQVWVIGMVFATMPRRRAPSITISETCRVISGEWGKFLALNNDTGIPKYILQDGVWAAKDIEVFRKYIHPGNIVIDVGANIGHHSVVYSKMVQANGKVLAIEPQRLMYQLLCANCAINKCNNIIPINIAAVEEQKQMAFHPISYDSPEMFGSLALQLELHHDWGGEVVVGRRLDDVIEEQIGDTAVDFVKLDVQAWEKFAIQGLARTIAAHHPTMFVEISPYWMRELGGYDYRDIYEILIDAGYQFEHFVELPLDERGIPVVDADVEWDVLAVHPLSRGQV